MSYNVTYFAANTTYERHFLEIPTALVIGALQLVGGSVGQLGADAYAREGRNFRLWLRPDNDHKNYLYVTHRWEIWSEVGTRDYDNRNYITPEFGYYEWTLKKRGLFEGRSWYKADFVWISHDPNITPDPAEANRLADATLAVLRSQRPAAAPEPPPVFERPERPRDPRMFDIKKPDV